MSSKNGQILYRCLKCALFQFQILFKLTLYFQIILTYLKTRINQKTGGKTPKTLPFSVHLDKKQSLLFDVQAFSISFFVNL